MITEKRTTDERKLSVIAFKSATRTYTQRSLNYDEILQIGQEKKNLIMIDLKNKYNEIHTLDIYNEEDQKSEQERFFYLFFDEFSHNIYIQTGRSSKLK